MSDFESIAILDDTIFPVTKEYVKTHHMIKVNVGDIIQLESLVKVFSALKMMLNSVTIRKPALIKLDQLFTHMKVTWKIDENLASVIIITNKLKKVLVILYKLPSLFPIDEIL